VRDRLSSQLIICFININLRWAGLSSKNGRYVIIHLSGGFTLDSVIQPVAINVTGWRPDELYSNYPEGARSKTAFFPPEGLEFSFISPARRYLYKRSVRRYPDQFWGEIVAYQIGCLLDLEVPPAFAAFDPQKGDCAALIEWFYEDGKASYTPGGNFMQLMMPNYDRKRGTQHNFRHTLKFCQALTKKLGGLQDPVTYWAETFLFDALIGNTDRHQDNWGYLFIPDKSGVVRANLTPLFDNGTSLGHERFTDDVENWTTEDFNRYVNKGTHHMKLLETDSSRPGHVDMLRSIITAHPQVADGLRKRVNNFSVDSLEVILRKLESMQIYVPLTPKRSDFYLKLVTLRRNNIITALS
jgi:hypothetical protein